MMYVTNKTYWEIEDKLYSPKRKTNNRQSKYIQHIMGSFYSIKMKRPVHYESLWGECLFFYILELDPFTVRYYEQPVEVPIYYQDKNGALSHWIHVPDVLIFRTDNKPILAQIKVELIESPKDKHIEKECEDFCEKKGWYYKTVVTKDLPEILKKNVLFLWNFKKERAIYHDLIPQVQKVMDDNEKFKILDLSQSIKDCDYREVIPLIYYMISNGLLSVNLFTPIDYLSEVKKGSIFEQLKINTLR
jgi:hypothetical protein